jgi:predicted amino acid racemase
MFLELTRRRNPRLIEASIVLHQQGKLPANCYAVDLDTVERNARHIADTASKFGMTVYAMTKQIGRNGSFCQAVVRGGIKNSVCVDMECARATHRAGMGIGHIGHLVQIPRFEADAAASLAPEYWTVFNIEKAIEAGAATKRKGRVQSLLARISAPGDQFYRGHEGGFPAGDVVEVASRLDDIDGGRFGGIVTFPTQLFDGETKKVVQTPNLSTLRRAAEALAKAGHTSIEINAPGTTSSEILPMLAEAGATQIEPGHGLTGTTPLHAVEDLPELPAVVYVTEVSHLFGGEAFCFGGGLYVDPVFPDYPMKALVSREPTSDASALRNVQIPSPASIDYYGMIEGGGGKTPGVGETVVFGFRPQVFVTRAYVAGISGCATANPTVETIHDAFGRPADWPI